MLEMEIAALAHFFRPLVKKQYFREIPENIVVPSVYFPVPEADGLGHSFNCYKNSVTLYVKVFHKDSFSSYSLAAELAGKLQECRRMIPLYDEQGNLTGKTFFVRNVKVKNVDAGVTQIMVSWDSVRTYAREASVKSSELFFEGLAAANVKEEEDD